jgi:hypothetical protein
MSKSLRKPLVIAAAAALGVAAVFASRAEATAVLVTDQQQSLTDSTGGAVAPSWTSFGESFKPGLSSIDWAEFSLRNESSPFTPISLSLSVLNGLSGTNGLQGTVLATSPAVSLTSLTYAPLHFQLASSLALTPGNTYVLRVNIITQNQGLGWEQKFGDAYTGGTMLQSPYDYTTVLAGQDYKFSEGTGVPEPSSALVLLGAGIMAGLRRRARRN